MLDFEEDEKLQLFADTSLWQDTIKQAIVKGIDKQLLKKLSSADYRNGLLAWIMSGEYVFSPPVFKSIPKDDGSGYRDLLISPELDRLVFAQITKVFYQLYGDTVNENCFAYRKGWSTARAVRNMLSRVNGNMSGYKSDYSKYFESVPRNLLNATLARFDTGSIIDKMLYTFYNTDFIIKDGKLISHYKSLTQGSAFSSFLANVCLKDLDDNASKLCKSYTRYCDDILVLGDGAKDALDYVLMKSNEFNLKINPKKLCTISDGDSFVFLGAKITGNKLNPGPHLTSTLKSEVRRIVSVYGKKNSRNAQKLVITKIKQWLYGCYTEDISHSWFACASNLINCSDDLRQLEYWIKDRIKASYAGCNNHTTYSHKTSNNLLEKLGWVSMIQMYNNFKLSKDLYYSEVRRIENETASGSLIVRCE